MKPLSFHHSLFIFLLLLVSNAVYAANPGKVEGSVVDSETGKAIPYANVELLQSSDSVLIKATLTDDAGKYRFDDLNAGKYVMRISFLGYRKSIVNEFEITSGKPLVQFGPTNLVAESKTLEEVTVIGQKLTGQIVEGKTVYTIRSKSAEFAQSGLELLRQLPDVTVGVLSDEVKLAGSNNLLFMVNGRKVDQNYLMQLNPSLVDKVEIINSPGAKYDSDVDAIINIVLKKNMDFGMSGRVRVQVPASSTFLSKNNANVDLYQKKVRFYLSGNTKYSSYEVENLNERKSGLSNEPVSMLTQSSAHVSKNINAGFNYGFDWFANDKNAFNFFSSVQPSIPNRNKVVTDNLYTHGQSVSHSLSTNNLKNEASYIDYSLFYKHVFGKNHEISLESYQSSRRDTRLSDYKEQAYEAVELPGGEFFNLLNQQLRNKNNQHVVKGDYTFPLSEKIKASAGYNGYFIRSSSAYAENITGFADDIRYNESRQVLYTNFMLNAGALSMQAGGRYEYSDIRIRHRFDTTNWYSYFLPSASVVYAKGKKNTFRFNYRRSVVRPNIGQLSPINYSNDAYLQSVGNPRLKPGVINRLEFTHRIQVSKPVYVSYIPYMTFIRNDIRQINLAGTDSVTRRQYANVSRDFEYGLTVSGTLAPVKWLSVNPSFTYFKRTLKALPEYGIPGDSKRTSWRINISSQVMLPRQWMVFVDYNYNAANIDIQTYHHPYYECVLGVNKAINKKLNLSVFTLNPWSQRYVYENSTVTSGNTTRHSQEALKYNYLVIFRIDYKFKIGKMGRQLEREHEQDDTQTPRKGIL